MLTECAGLLSRKEFVRWFDEAAMVRSIARGADCYSNRKSLDNSGSPQQFSNIDGGLR
jgi:hypothetical protein